MKKSRAIWNYIDMLLEITFVIVTIFITYLITENLEKFFYRYTVFPFVAFFLIFNLGLYLGRGIERTRKNKPIGFVSRKMAKERKKKNMFIFSDNGNTYSPNKEIVEEIKSGEIVHVKYYEENPFEENDNLEDFDELYNIKIDDLIDDKMDKEDKEK